MHSRNCKNVTFTGVEIEGNFDGWDIEGANFRGALGKPIIHPNKLGENGLLFVILEDAYVSGNCDNVVVVECSFKGAHIDYDNFSFNPKKVKGKSLEKTFLEGVPINGNLDGVHIKRTNFKGYVGEVTFNTEKNNDDILDGNVFDGVTINGNLSNKMLINNDFSGSKGGLFDFFFFFDWPKGNNFKGITFIGTSGYSKIESLFKENEMADSILAYNMKNKELVMKYMTYVQKQGLDTDIIILKNLDEEIENPIKSIIGNEIVKQKIKTKDDEKNS